MILQYLKLSGWYQGFQSHHGDMSGDICIRYYCWGGLNPSEVNGNVVWNVGMEQLGVILVIFFFQLQVDWVLEIIVELVSSTSNAVFLVVNQVLQVSPSWATDCVTNMHQLWDGTIIGQLRGELPKPLRCMGVTGTEHDTFIVGGLQSVVPYAYYNYDGVFFT